MLMPGSKALRKEYTRIALSGMVTDFYQCVRTDPELGPVFATKIRSWEPHLERMTDFWQSVLTSAGVFRLSERGGPPELHRQIAGLAPHHFDRWLELFAEVVRRRFSAAAAENILVRAQRMAVVLSAHLPPVDSGRA